VNDLWSAIEYLAGQSEVSLVLLFWYTLISDVPRYVVTFAAMAVAAAFEQRVPADELAPIDPKRVTVIVVGLNEADSIERCILSLHEQSIQGFDIVIVSDGSTDGMAQRADDLVRRGLARTAIALDLRGGKPAGTNLALIVAQGEFVVELDCDCSLDRYAIERILAPLSDPTVGAVAGDIVVRNANETLMARFQSIEYLLTISVAKRFDDAFGLVRCVSGAFGAFRRAALEQVGGHDAGGGEDFDLTFRLRERGWRIAFAQDAICYTDVPATLWAYFRQRQRSEGDAVGLRLRKHLGVILPGSSRFNLVEAVHQWDFLLFNVFGAVMLPVYVAWLYSLYGGFALVILGSMVIGLSLLNVIVLLLAALITDRDVFFPNLIYIPGFTIFNSFVMRTIQLIAYVREWFLFRSQSDNYSPPKVRAVNDW
jgi:cellulose synthase/poly-beta-1,6-N-acetylglucosamine synthase-like glycosyltransferase